MSADRISPRLTVDNLMRQAILDELARVFGAASAIDLLLDRIGFPLHQRPHFGGGDTSQSHWRELCRQIAEGVTAGGLEALLAAAAHLRPHNRLFAPWAHGPLLSGLLPLLGGLPLSRQEIVAVYRRSAPPSWEPPATADPCTLLRDCARRLADAPAQSGTRRFPLLCFVHSLRGCADAGLGSRLDAWLEQAAAHLGADLAAYEPPSDSTKGAAGGECHVLVCFDQAAQGTEEYLVRAWMYRGAERIDLPLEKEPWTAHNRARMLGKLCREVTLRADPSCHPVLEFVVPRTLLGANLDQWEMLIEEFGHVKLGAYWPFVVRPLERTRHPEARTHLARRWQEVHLALEQPCRLANLPLTEQAAAVWVSDSHGHKLFGWLNISRTVACAVLERAPKAGAGGGSVDTLRALLLAGIPIMLWPRKALRKSVPAEEGLRELGCLLEGKPLRGLPRRVFEHRCLSLPTSEQLTLVWDDPTRPVPEAADPHYFLEIR